MSHIQEFKKCTHKYPFQKYYWTVGSNHLRKYRRLGCGGWWWNLVQQWTEVSSWAPENSISKPLSSSSRRKVLGRRGESEALSMCETLRTNKNSGSRQNNIGDETRSKAWNLSAPGKSKGHTHTRPHTCTDAHTWP